MVSISHTGHRHVVDGICPDMSFAASTLMVSSPNRAVYKVGDWQSCLIFAYLNPICSQMPCRTLQSEVHSLSSFPLGLS